MISHIIKYLRVRMGRILSLIGHVSIRILAALCLMVGVIILVLGAPFWLLPLALYSLGAGLMGDIEGKY